MNKTNAARILSLAAYLGLLGFVLAWSILLGDLPGNQISLTLLVLGVPLLLPLRGILHGRDRSIIWGTLVSLLYLVHGGIVWWSEPAHAHWGVLEMFLSLLFVFSASFFIRWRAEQAAANDS